MLRSMQMRLTRAAVSAALLLLAVIAMLGLTACGGGSDSNPSDSSSPTVTSIVTGTPDAALQPYFTQLDAIFQKASDDTVAANAELSTALNNAQAVDEEKAALDTFLTKTEAAFDVAIAAMNGMTVPSEGQSDHNTFVTSAAASRALAEQLQQDLAAATTDEQVQALLNNFDTDKQPLLTNADQACKNLQETATSHGVDIDLACSG